MDYIDYPGYFTGHPDCRGCFTLCAFPDSRGDPGYCDDCRGIHHCVHRGNPSRRFLRGVPGADPAWLFADGIRYIAIQVVYAIPVIIILAVTVGSSIMAVVSAGPDFEDLLPILGGVLFGVLVALVVGFIIGLFAIFGVVRFARTGSMGEAFNFRGIVTTIGRIGWGSYILALIVVVVIVVIVQIVIGIIPYIGGVLQLIVSPFITIFYSRYIALLYDSAGEVAAPV
jgi:hypothetical protein